MIDISAPKVVSMRNQSTVSTLSYDEAKVIEKEEGTNAKKHDIKERLQVVHEKYSRPEASGEEEETTEISSSGIDSSQYAEPNVADDGDGDNDNANDETYPRAEVKEEVAAEEDRCSLDAKPNDNSDSDYLENDDQTIHQEDDDASNSDGEYDDFTLLKVTTLYLSRATEPTILCTSKEDMCPRENPDTTSEHLSSTSAPRSGSVKSDRYDDVAVKDAAVDDGSLELSPEQNSGLEEGDESGDTSRGETGTRSPASILKKCSFTTTEQEQKQKQQQGKDSDSTPVQTESGMFMSFLKRVTSLPNTAGKTIHGSVALKKHRSAHPKSPKSLHQQQSAKQRGRILPRPTSFKEENRTITKPEPILRSASTGTPRNTVPKATSKFPSTTGPSKFYGRKSPSPEWERRNVGVIPLSSEKEETKKTESEKLVLGTRPSSSFRELRNMVDRPILLAKARTTHSQTINTVAWKYPMETKSGLHPMKTLSELDSRLTQTETELKKEAARAIQIQKEESASADTIVLKEAKSNPALVRKYTKEEDCMDNHQPRDSITIHSIESRGSAVSEITRETDATAKVVNRSVRTFHPFRGVQRFDSAESEKDKSQSSSPNEIRKKKNKKVYKMTQGLGQGTKESDKKNKAFLEIKRDSSRRTVKKPTSIETSKEWKRRFTLKMW